MRSSFCGREKEMGLLKLAWGKANNIQNPEPQLIVLMGESGLGKTRIIQEFYHWLSATYDAKEPNGYWPDDLGHEQNNLKINPTPDACNNSEPMPYLWWGIRLPDPTARNTIQAGSALNSHLNLFISHLEPVMNRLREIDRQVKGGKALMKAAVDVGLSFIPGASAFDSIKTGMEALLELVNLRRESSGDRKEYGIRELHAQQHKSQAEIVLNALSALMAGKNSLTPTAACLIIDDAQFSNSDPSLSSFTEQLITQAFSQKWPLMIIVTYWQAEWRKDWAADKLTIASAIRNQQSYFSNAWRPIELSPVEDLGPMLKQALPGLLPDQRSSLLKRVGGNPRYMDEIIRFCQQHPRHFINRDLRNPLNEKGFKDCMDKSLSLHELVQSRFNALPDEVKEAIAIASMQGQRFLTNLTKKVGQTLGSVSSEAGLNDAEYPHSLINGVPSGIAEFSQRIFYEVASEFIDDIMDREAAQDVLKSLIRQRLNEELKKPSEDRLQREITLAVAVGLFEVAETAEDQQYGAKALAELTHMALERCDYITAMEMAQRFLAGIAANSWNFSSLNFYQMYDLQNVFGIMEDSVANQEIAEAMLKLAKQSFRDDPNDKDILRQISIAWSVLGEIALRREQIDKAKDLFERAHELFNTLTTVLGTHSAYRELAISWAKLGDIALIQCQIVKAKTAYLKTHEIFMVLVDESGTPKARRDLSTSWAQLGDIAFRQGQFDSAKIAHQTALEIRELLVAELGTPDARQELSLSWDCLGEVELSLKQINSAKAAFEKALEIRKVLACEFSSPKVRRDLAVSWDYLGNVAFRLGQLDKAQTAYQKSLEISEAMVAELNTPENNRSLAVAWGNLGQIALEQGGIDRALEFHQKAFALREQLVAELNTPKVRWEFALSSVCLGDIALRQERFDIVISAYQKAHEIFQVLAAELNTSEARRDLSESWKRLGGVALQQGNVSSAKAAFEKALKTCELLATELNTPEALKDLAILYACLGDLARSQNQINSAKSLYQTAHEIFVELAVELKTTAARESLSLSWNMLGDIAHMQGQVDSAMTSYQKAIDINVVLVADLSTPKAHSELSALYYRLAALAESRGDLDYALQGFMDGLVQAKAYQEMVLSPDADQLVVYFENKIHQLKGAVH